MKLEQMADETLLIKNRKGKSSIDNKRETLPTKNENKNAAPKKKYIVKKKTKVSDQATNKVTPSRSSTNQKAENERRDTAVTPNIANKQNTPIEPVKNTNIGHVRPKTLVRSGGYLDDNRVKTNKSQPTRAKAVESRDRNTPKSFVGGYQTKAKVTDRQERDNRQQRGGPRKNTSRIYNNRLPGGRRYLKRIYKSKESRYREKEIQLKQPGSSHAPVVPKQIDIMGFITLSDFARKMNLKASVLIAKLMEMGTMVNINQQLDAETATLLASEYGCTTTIVSLYDETVIETAPETDVARKTRPPIITVMGHVDHGKTKLLDTIRAADVVSREYGGITQHIGAYQVELEQGKITFLDTPGHAAFTLMRARGAKVTDIIVLVVAANDGVMPQTKEAIDHARVANVPIIVAVNKIDLADANPERTRQQLSDLGLVPEEWGGDTLFCDISALTGEGIEGLLDSLLLQAEMLELSAMYGCRAEGTIIESRIDHGRGMVATVLVQKGKLSIGDNFVAGVYPGRVRAMFNDRGEQIANAFPTMPVEILGFAGLPNSGDPFQVTANERIARAIGGKRQELRKVEESGGIRKVTLENLYESIQEGEIQELNVIVKGDVHGSVEAIQNSLEKLSTQDIKLVVVRAAAGAVNDNDVLLASTSRAIIVGFNVHTSGKVQEIADREKIEIRRYNIIYEVVEDIKNAMEGLLAPDLREEQIGEAEVREVFKVSRIGTIAGSFVISGKMRRGASAAVIRDSIEIYRSTIISLQRFKDSVREVETNFECGIGIENFNDIKIGDRIVLYETKKVAKKLITTD